MHSLALSLSLKLQRAMMAIRVVAWFAEERARHPGASAHADVGVVALAAIAPEISGRAIAHVAQRLRSLPNVAQAFAPDVPSHPGVGGKRRTAFDVAVRFDSQGHPTG